MLEKVPVHEATETQQCAKCGKVFPLDDMIALTFLAFGWSIPLCKACAKGGDEDGKGR